MGFASAFALALLDQLGCGALAPRVLQQFGELGQVVGAAMFGQANDQAARLVGTAVVRRREVAVGARGQQFGLLWAVEDHYRVEVVRWEQVAHSSTGRRTKSREPILLLGADEKAEVLAPDRAVVRAREVEDEPLD